MVQRTIDMHGDARDRKTILIIEDDNDLRENTAEILSLANYQVITAPNGRAGLEMAREHLPDLILCDITMPEMDGYGVLHMLNRERATAEIPFIFISARTERGDLRRGMEAGADDYLTKPFNEVELLRALESRLKRREIFEHEYENDANGLFDLLRDAANLGRLNELTQERQLKSVPAKSILFREGEELHNVFLVDDGKVRTFRTTEEGKELVTGIHGKGDFIGYMNAMVGERSTETAETIENSRLAWIPARDLLELLYKDRDVSLRFIKMLTHNVHEKEQQLLSLAYGTVRQRIAQALLKLRERFPGVDGPEIEISRDDLASMVGTATESVIRSLSDLKAEGLIGLYGKNIQIRDPKAVRRLARL